MMVQLVLGLLWQLLTLFSPRLFRGGRKIPNWAIALVETIGCLAFLALVVGNAIAIDFAQGYSTYYRLNQVMLVTYGSAVWVVLCLLHGALAIQCYAQGWRNVRPKRAGCPHCDDGEGKGKGRAGDEEEALLAGGFEGHAANGAGPSEQPTLERYRDEENRDEEV
ncbi:MAG: hypothetical protein Q9208_003343 [Pyrenodesmia sp. 3 TL-2023]